MVSFNKPSNNLKLLLEELLKIEAFDCDFVGELLNRHGFMPILYQKQAEVVIKPEIPQPKIPDVKKVNNNNSDEMLDKAQRILLSWMTKNQKNSIPITEFSRLYPEINFDVENLLKVDNGSLFGIEGEALERVIYVKTEQSQNDEESYDSEDDQENFEERHRRYRLTKKDMKERREYNTGKDLTKEQIALKNTAYKILKNHNSNEMTYSSLKNSVYSKYTWVDPMVNLHLLLSNDDRFVLFRPKNSPNCVKLSQ